jgi:hypothetical protein
MNGKTFFVSVVLTGGDGKPVSDALYPIAVTATAKGNDYAGIFAGMDEMPQADLVVTAADPRIVMMDSKDGSCDIVISNPTGRLAFFLRVRLLEESGSLRTTYSDNYVSILPGESKNVRVTVQSTMPETLPSKLRFEVSGWNTRAKNVDVEVIPINTR